uniref:uncharacterized protein LOC120337444 n=1 Tax=Styela clava TaxID=7725 RepID=UPI00193A636A|nr:uncharacterized protein LOC120337444 [Styela clava]
MDPNDSDGSWEFVDHKDSDSDASSVASPYDTGLPEENLATLPSQNEESVGSAWNNHDDFITDSDIEACAEEPPESDDGDGDITLKQDTLPSSPQIDKDDLAPEMQSSEEHGSQSSSSTITKSVTAMEDENPPQMVAETCDDINTSAISETDCQQNDNTSPEDADHPTEEMTSQEITIKDASLVDDITVPLTDSEQTLAVLESLQLPPISSASSESSDFERIDSTSDLTSVTTNSDLNFEPDVIQSLDLKPEEGEVPSIEIESFSTGEDQDSDEGSITFAVISAPPPTEIISHKIATSVIFGDDSTNQRSVGMVTEAALAKHNLVDMATEPDMANQKTVGMVTEQAGPPNQRLLISFIALSFGVGFLLGATVPMSQSTVLQYPEEIVALEEKEIPPFSLRDIYKESENPLTKGGIERNDFMKYKLFMENSRLRNTNRGLRSNIRKLKEENNKFMTKQSDKTTDAERSSIALALLQKSLQKSQELNKIEFEKRDKEIMKLQTELQVAEDENTFMTTNMDLYKRLQAQHSELTALHEKSLRAHSEEKASLLERQQSLKHRLHRYRTESRNLIQQSNKLKIHNLQLKSVIQSYESRHQQPSTPSQSEPTKTLSPLMLAFAARRQKTCPSSSKFRSQVKLLQLRLRRQRSKMRKLEQGTHLKSIALEKLYNTMGDLSNYAMCLGQQLKMPLNKRAKDPVEYCRSTSSEPKSASSFSSSPKNYPQCSYHVNGTLAVDFSSLNVTVKGFKDTTSYKLQILSDRTTRLFISTLLFFIEKPITLAPSCDNNPHDLDLILDTNTTSVFGPKFVPAHLYAHVVTKNVRARREISNHKAEFLSLLRTISVNNQSLDVSRKETEMRKIDWWLRIVN